MRKLLKYNIIIPIIILNIISLIYLYSTAYFTKQLLFIIIGLTLLIITSLIPQKKYKKYLPFIYILCNILLILVLIFGKEINGSKAWLHIFNFSIQPSELTKLILSIYAPYLVMKNKKIPLIILTIIPTILTYLEPDTGAIIFYLIILITSLYYCKKNKIITLLIVLLSIIFISSNVYLYFHNHETLINIYGTKLFYRIDRLVSFKNQNNIQNINSIISIGSHHLLYIPENHNDFIYAAILSSYPYISFFFITISYLHILLYLISNLTNKKNISNIYTNIVLNMLLFQIFYNILMNLSLLPIIGIPLPFLSYGGSYLITLYMEIGILINNKKVLDNKVHNKDYKQDLHKQV